MILVWPCEAEGCGVMVTNPEGCPEHAPKRSEDETFEEALIRAMTTPLREGGIPISGMRFE
jgi:hypothetical protein